MDVFSTQSLTSAQFILSLFSNLGDDSADDEYKLSVPNTFQAIFNQSFKAGTPAESGYLFSTIVVHNDTALSGWVSDLSSRSVPDTDTDTDTNTNTDTDTDTDLGSDPDPDPDSEPNSGSGSGSGNTPPTGSSGGVTNLKITPLM